MPSSSKSKNELFKTIPLIISLTGLIGQASATLVAYYNMEQGSSPLIDQVGGEIASAVDSGHQYGAAGPAGFGNAVGLNANGGWQLSVADSAALNLANNFTVAGWINIDSAIVKSQPAADNHRILGDDSAWDGDGWAFGVTGGVMRFTRNGIVDADDPSGTAVPTDSWVHIAATPTSTGITFYLTGVLTGTNGNGADNNTGLGNNGLEDPYGVGRAYGNAQDQYFPGLLDEVRVYDSVLTQPEIAALMTAVPEPSTGLLIGLAGLAVGLRRRRSC